MGHKYQAVLWNRQKRKYDIVLFLSVLLLLFLFIVAQYWLAPNITPQTLLIRASAFVAIVLLQFILTIGPLCRISTLFLPLLYNRRHLGVTMFFFALVHGGFSIIQFHGYGNINPIASVFLSNENYLAISEFPFQVFGFFALLIFCFMAITSHDFWLKNLSPKVWKSLHMLVYVAYALVLLHIALGILQYNENPIYWILLVGGFIVISVLHLWAGIKGVFELNKRKNYLKEKGFYKICSVSDIEENYAKIIFIKDQNIAIFKYDNKVSAVHNVCKHQMGPLGEGKIVDGCITCPWHGYQYMPENGKSPKPFKEVLHTYETKILKNNIWINPDPKPEGTYIKPSEIKQ